MLDVRMKHSPTLLLKGDRVYNYFLRESEADTWHGPHCEPNDEYKKLLVGTALGTARSTRENNTVSMLLLCALLSLI